MVTGFSLCPFHGVFAWFFSLQVRNLLDKLVHPVRTGLFHLLGCVSVHVKRKRGCRVAQVCLYGLRIVTGLKRSNGKAVSEVVQASIRQTDRGNDPFIVVVNSMRGKVFPDLIAEHKVMILP